MSPGEKFDQCERAKKREIDVIIGPRSALFTPFSELGLIVIDEEHENTYKSDSMPRYHAREVAGKLAQLTGASLVLGSATPSVESYFRALKGDYKLFSMTKRATGAVLAQTKIVDMRKELHDGNKSIFSNALKDSIADRLNKGQQIMLFLNRRGYAGFVSCRDARIAMCRSQSIFQTAGLCVTTAAMKRKDLRYAHGAVQNICWDSKRERNRSKRKCISFSRMP